MLTSKIIAALSSQSAPPAPSTQQAKLNASDAEAGDRFGLSVSISGDGNTALIGAYAEAPGGLSNAGSAYVFTRSGSTWSQQAKLNASDAEAGDRFGYSVSISSDGNTALIGAYYEAPGGLSYAGSAYVFTRSGSTWTQQAKLVASDAAASDYFGISVSISSDGNTALIGAYGEDPGGVSGAGSAYVFTRSGSTWTQQAELVASDAEAGDRFGYSVSISSDGNTALIGAYYEDPGGLSNAGSAYVFTRSGSTWTQQAKLVASDAAASDNFGWSVSISSDGNTAIVGAYVEAPGGLSDAGSAYVFTRSGSTWTQQAKLNASDAEASDLFGYSVSISSDGNTAIVGARNEAPGGLSAAGSAYVFTRSGSTWAQQAKLDASDAEASDNFGWSVSISGDGNTALIGANTEDPGGLSNAGSAYVFV